jgi:predicted phosphoadenosine phosphosulfate sulfurtransferase
MGKKYLSIDVLTAAKKRISLAFDTCERYYVAFSGGKDSTTMTHLVMEEAIKRSKKVALMYIDFEAQYADTVEHLQDIFETYRDHIEMHWIAIPMLLRNALTNYEPRWMCWDTEKKESWIRPKPLWAKTESDYPFAVPGMEFEEFIVLFGQWYGQGQKTAGFIGIRAQESLHRYCAIATWEKIGLTLNGWRWTTKIT